MKEYMKTRVLEIGEYMKQSGATVRKTASIFGISKSTVHKDCTQRLEEIDPNLATEVRQILDKNKQERHIRGGLATKAKYEKANALRQYSILMKF